jgi:hypothetical protein
MVLKKSSRGPLDLFPRNVNPAIIRIATMIAELDIKIRETDLFMF